MLERAALLRPPLLSRANLQLLFENADLAGEREAAETLRRFHGLTRKRTQTSAPRPGVEIYCLGRFAIVRDGALLTWQRKAPRRPLDLLKAVIAHGTGGASAQRLTDLVWAPLDADNARQAFASALYRLRRMLGESTLVLHASHLRLAPELTWIDAFEFESGAQRDEVDALRLYAGHFLAEDEAGWIVTARDRLRETHRRALCRAAERVLAEGRWREALDLYNSGLQRDDLAEMFFQGAIAACLAGGLRAEASALYERCRSALSEQLGLSPSPKTEALYRSVIRSA